MTNEVIKAYKYVFSQPGALTPPINYYRNVLSYPKPNDKQISIPTLLIWVTYLDNSNFIDTVDREFFML